MRTNTFAKEEMCPIVDTVLEDRIIKPAYDLIHEIESRDDVELGFNKDTAIKEIKYFLLEKLIDYLKRYNPHDTLSSPNHRTDQILHLTFHKQRYFNPVGAVSTYQESFIETGFHRDENKSYIYFCQCLLLTNNTVFIRKKVFNSDASRDLYQDEAEFPWSVFDADGYDDVVNRLLDGIFKTIMDLSKGKLSLNTNQLDPNHRTIKDIIFSQINHPSNASFAEDKESIHAFSEWYYDFIMDFLMDRDSVIWTESVQDDIIYQTFEIHTSRIKIKHSKDTPFMQIHFVDQGDEFIYHRETETLTYSENGKFAKYSKAFPYFQTNLAIFTSLIEYLRNGVLR